MPHSFQDAALIIVGHGSTVNPDSSAPTHLNADEIRKRDIFAEVQCAFWKEEPSMREVFYMVKSRTIYVVPNFISEGYFCQEVLPRELRLDGQVTHRAGQTIYYCDPVGTHPSMTKLLLKRADESAPGVPRNETALIIVGHGTQLNDNSRKAIEEQVRLIKEGGYGFAEVLDAFMEEAPLVAEWPTLTTAPNVVVVPFFIADGLHSYQDIPVLLGLESEPTAALSQSDVFRNNPRVMHGRNLYYGNAIGTDPWLVDVILDQVNDFAKAHVREAGDETPAKSAKPSAFESFFLAEGAPTSVKMGQLRIVHDAHGWLCLHEHDAAANEEDLELIATPEAIRAVALYDDAGEYRKLKSAPTLRHGWKVRARTLRELRLALDFLYPAAVGLWEHWVEGTLLPVPLRETLARQTGMYRFANKITDEQAQNLVAEETEATTQCLRKIMWPLESGVPLTAISENKLPPAEPPCDEILLLSVEADTHLVSAARELSKKSRVPAATVA